MHIDYWGLTHSPFASQLDPKDYYPSLLHEEALARLDFLISNGRRLGFLMGAAGTGKSLLLEVVVRQLRSSSIQMVKLNAVGLSGTEFVWKLAVGLGCPLGPHASPLELWRGISDHVLANRYQGVSTLLLVDDADEATSDVCAAISRTALIEPHPDTRLTLILTAQRPRTANLGTKLNELCDLRIELEPLDEVETAAYLEYALQQAGARRSLFSISALERLFELTRGNPRRIRQLAELCLLAAAAEQASEVSVKVVDSVQQGLSSECPAEAA